MSRRTSTPGTRYLVILALLLGLALVAAACDGDGDDDAADDVEADDGADDDAADDDAADDEADDDAADGDGEVEEEAQAGRATIGTHAIGGGYHAVGSGVAAAVSGQSDLNVSVQPYAGPNAWLVELNAGDLAFGLASTVDAGWSYTGGPGFDEPLENVRTVLEGNDLFNWGVVARADSDIESISDLEGRDVGSEYGGNIFSARLVEADLASVDLGWDDVNAVPQPEPFIGLEALQNNEIEATAGLSPDTPAVMELAESIGGIQALPFADYEPADIEDGIPDEAQEVLDEYVAGATLDVVEEGTGAAEEDTVVFAYGLQMLGGADAPDDLVYDVLSVIWEHYEEIHGVHPWADQWDPERMPTTAFEAPYHDGAVAFYEDEGVWTDEHQEQQDALLEEHE